MRNFFYYSFLLFLLFISGCIQEEGTTTQTITSSEKGLIITNFTTDTNTLRINEATNIRISFFNNGDFNARNISSIFYGEGLLEQTNEINFSNLLLPNQQAFHFLNLKVPTTLSQSESTSYSISSKIYYLYNFSGFHQVGIVSPDYAGGDVPLSSDNMASPLSTSIEVRNPIRTNEFDNAFFTVTIKITNNGLGDLDYYNCSAISGCNKNNHLNTLSIQIPINWIPNSNILTSDTLIVKSNDVDGIKTFIWDYDKLIEAYDVSGCSTSNNDECVSIREALNQLRLVRGEEALIVLQFSHGFINETLIDELVIKGDFGYEFDARDFKRPIYLNVLGD